MFIGQQHIINELEALLPTKEPFNLLLLGPPGQGKTLLGLKICNYITKDFMYKIANSNENFFMDINQGLNKYLVWFIDEVHRLGFEIERLYPILDSRQRTFIFATNQPQLLPEAFRTRVIEGLFSRYSHEELRQIVQSNLSLPFSDELLDVIIASAEENPRRIKQYCVRILSIMKSQNITITTKEELINIIEHYFNIVDGLTSLEREYLNVLQRMGTASLPTLTSILGVGKEVLMTEIEPPLLYKNKIKISSKGRQYVD